MHDYNGTSPLDDPIVEAINERVAHLDNTRTLHIEEIAAIDREIKRYEKALKALVPEEMKRTARNESVPNEHARKRRKEAAMRTIRNNDIWPILKAEILAYVDKHDETRQVDFREHWKSLSHDFELTSSKCSIAFEILRDEKLLRLGRIDGNSRFYKLYKEG